MYRTSLFNVLINQRDAALLMNDLYYSLFGSTCFGLSPVHHHEHHLVNCITHWYVRAGGYRCCVDIVETFKLISLPNVGGNRTDICAVTIFWV